MRLKWVRLYHTVFLLADREGVREEYRMFRDLREDFLPSCDYIVLEPLTLRPRTKTWKPRLGLVEVTTEPSYYYEREAYKAFVTDLLQQGWSTEVVINHDIQFTAEERND